jgi:hypothetical protein
MNKAISGQPTSLIIIYSCGGFRAATPVVRSDDATTKPTKIARDDCLPANKVLAFFSNPFANLADARMAPLKIENALVTPVSSEHGGWLIAVSVFIFMAFSPSGRVCVCVAGAIRIDADAHPFQRHEHRAAHQLGRLDDHRRDISADRRQIRLLDHGLSFCRLHGDLFHHRRVFPVGNQGQDLGRN